MYNLLLYIVMGLMVFSLMVFIFHEKFKRDEEIRAFKQKQLTNSFNKNIPYS